MTTLVPLNVILADRQFFIRVNAEDQATVLKTIDAINEKILEFKKKMPGFDMQHYISLAFMWYATQPDKETVLTSEFLVMQEELTILENVADKIIANYEDL